MSTRVTFGIMNRNLLSALNVTLQNQNTAMNQVESGLRVTQPSDDPAAEAAYIQNRSEASAATQYLQTASTLSGNFQVAESALNDAVNVIDKAITTGVEGGSSTASPSQQQAMAQVVDNLQQQMVNVANTTFQGNYIFSGSNTGTAAYVLDATQTSGVKYQGNAEVNQVNIAQNNSVQANVPGNQIFDNAFQALNDLKTGLTTGNTTQVESAVTSLRNALDTVNQQRTTYSAGVTRLESAQTLLQNETVQLASQENTLVGANLASAITNENTATTARDAILQLGSKLSQVSLLNYM